MPISFMLRLEDVILMMESRQAAAAAMEKTMKTIREGRVLPTHPGAQLVQWEEEQE